MPHIVDLVDFRAISNYSQYLCPRCFDLGNDGGESFTISSVNDKPDVIGSEIPRSFRADSARGTTDNGNFASQVRKHRYCLGRGQHRWFLTNAV
jgi:hypothetical protein